LAIFAGCVKPIHKQLGIDQKVHSIIQFSDDGFTATITTDQKLTGLDSLTFLANQPISMESLIGIIQPELHDSSIAMFADVIKRKIPKQKLVRSLSSLKTINNRIMVTYSVDTSFIMPQIRRVFVNMDLATPIEPLFDRKGKIPDFSLISPSTALILPCEGQQLPRKASRLPNAPRDYRSGIHRGIDFFSNWGTPVKSVADGMIVRSDLNYEEVPADFRDEILKQAAKLDRTPSDIFNAILLGKAVFIDHGFDLFKGYRSITIYAHLSYINPNIKPGYKIQAGEIFARSGNSGTRPSTLGTRDEAHLHWELILQDAKGEFYFGQNLPYESLYPALISLFNN